MIWILWMGTAAPLSARRNPSSTALVSQIRTKPLAKLKQERQRWIYVKENTRNGTEFIASTYFIPEFLKQSCSVVVSKWIFVVTYINSCEWGILYHSAFELLLASACSRFMVLVWRKVPESYQNTFHRPKVICTCNVYQVEVSQFYLKA